MEKRMDKDVLLECNEIVKKYSSNIVLNGINLDVKKGQGIALVGENGCGKSTLVRIMAGLTQMTSGKCMYQNQIKISYIPDHYDGLSFTFEEFMNETLKMEGINDDYHKKKIQFYYEAFSLGNMIHTRMKNLSKGTLQKAAVIQSLIGEYDIIFMDEPLSGQDIHSQEMLMSEILERKKAGTSIVIACHERVFMEHTADEIYQIKDGKLVDGNDYLVSKIKE